MKLYTLKIYLKNETLKIFKRKSLKISEEMIDNIQEEIANYKKLQKEKEEAEEKLRLKAFPDFFLKTWYSSSNSLESINMIMKNLTKAPRLTHQEFTESDRNYDLIVDTLTYGWRNDIIVATHYEDPSDEMFSAYIVKKNDEIIVVDDEEEEDDDDALKYLLTDCFLYERNSIRKCEDYLDSYLKLKLLE